jgi:serine/threonine protein kinase
VSGLDPGTLLHDRYRIVRPIGRGGMGAVFEAVDTRLHHTVAVKQTTAADAAGLEAFEQEARILASLRHPALPVVSDYFADAAGWFLVMQLIEGDDLSRLLRHRGGPFPEADVTGWARCVLEALIYLHGHAPPVVHRDIKPGNLRRTPRGEIVLIDFGLAKRRADDETQLARDASVYGYTPRYSPPEQVAGSGTDPRSDLYALGATLFHLVTGVTPPGASERLFALQGGRQDVCRPAHVVATGVTERFGTLVARAMAIDPADRFASARDMLDALGDAGVASVRTGDDQSRESIARRVDAAMPRHVEVGRQVDLLVQVRFVDSPLLGLEDWPSRRRPEQIDQASETLRLTHPTDPATGRRQPARVRFRLTAPDFTLAGDADRSVDVPPAEFSPRVAFLLSARRSGVCRVNIDVFNVDDVYLGSVPVEAEGVGSAAAEGDLRVANLVLEVLSRSVDEAVRRAEAGAQEQRARHEAARAARRPARAEVGAALPPPAAASQSVPPATRRAPARRLLIAPLLAVVFAAGWMFWGMRMVSPAPETMVVSAPPTTSAPAPADPAGTMPLTAADGVARAAMPNPKQEALRDLAILRAAQDYARDFNKRYERMSVHPSAALEMLSCHASSSDAGAKGPTVRLESATRARVACVSSFVGDGPSRSRETGRAGGSREHWLIVELRDGLWRVVPSLPRTP